jgi:hypothetical protein
VEDKIIQEEYVKGSVDKEIKNNGLARECVNVIVEEER